MDFSVTMQQCLREWFLGLKPREDKDEMAFLWAIVLRTPFCCRLHKSKRQQKAYVRKSIAHLKQTDGGELKFIHIFIYYNAVKKIVNIINNKFFILVEMISMSYVIKTR